MVKLLVSIGMELEGVEEVRPADDYEYFFTVMCTGCREEHPKIVSFNREQEHELSGSRGSANFVWRCPHCKKEHSASFIPPTPTSKSTSPHPYAGINGQPTLTPFIGLDCRGLEFTKFHFKGKWLCKSVESGVEFEFDLDDRESGEEGRWDDYDDKAEAPVSVSEMKSVIGRM